MGCHCESRLSTGQTPAKTRLRQAGIQRSSIPNFRDRDDRPMSNFDLYASGLDNL